MKLNDFYKCLSDSIESSNEKMFEDFYFKVFGKELKEVKQVTDRDLQRKGVDKILIFYNGKELYIDEKKRFKKFDSSANTRTKKS